MPSSSSCLTRSLQVGCHVCHGICPNPYLELQMLWFVSWKWKWSFLHHLMRRTGPLKMFFLKGQPTTSQDCRGVIPEIPSHLFSPLQSNAMFLSELHFFWFCEFSHVHRHLLKHQSGRKCVSVAAALRAKQGPWELIKDCTRKIR